MAGRIAPLTFTLLPNRLSDPAPFSTDSTVASGARFGENKPDHRLPNLHARSPMRPSLFSLALLLTCSAPALADDLFASKVRPILARYCFKCHGPDDAVRKAKM